MTVRELLDRSRKELLDLSTRNRLLSIPVDSKSARLIHVHDELSEQVYRTLILDRKALSFLPGRSTKVQDNVAANELPVTDEDEIGLPQPEEDEELVNGVAKRHTDLRLQTSLSPEGLQRKLLSLFHDSQTMIEEQGVNILYLALGHLKWYEIASSEIPRYAPLVLLPVSLFRKSASERFFIRWNEDDLEGNLSLAGRLKQDFDVDFPSFSDEDDFSLNDYFEQVQAAVSGGKGWEVLPNSMTLGFFSFAKFLMYRDLDADTWPGVEMLCDHPLVRSLLLDGFERKEPAIDESEDLDEIIPVSQLDHVVDADSSQTICIESIRRGSNLVVQGPPGTGKSQSITNIIANAVLDGKKVLFVAEKLAALEVVKRRLEREGLSSVCLELHSNKSNKRAVVEEISSTWKLGRPKELGLERMLSRLEELRSSLNAHARVVNSIFQPSGLTPFNVLWKLVQFSRKETELREHEFTGTLEWTRDGFATRLKLVEEIASRVENMGVPIHHPWWGIRRDLVLQIDLSSIVARIKETLNAIRKLRISCKELARVTSRQEAMTLQNLLSEIRIAEYVSDAPELDRDALRDAVWASGITELRSVVNHGQRFSSIHEAAKNLVNDAAWRGDTSVQADVFLKHGNSFFRFLNGKYRRAFKDVRQLLKGEMPRRYVDRVSLVDKIVAGQKEFKELQKGNPTGKLAFGRLWLVEKSDWDKLDAIITWFCDSEKVGLEPTFRTMMTGIGERDQVRHITKTLDVELRDVGAQIEKLDGMLSIDSAKVFSCEKRELMDLGLLEQKCSQWVECIGQLIDWSNYIARSEEARRQGLSSLIDQLDEGTIAAVDLASAFKRSYYVQIFRAMVQKEPELARFDGLQHNKIIDEFRILDRDRLSLAKYRLLLKHHHAMPPKSGIGPAGILLSETERKRGHRTVRRLLRDAGSVVQAIKPVFMMSPLSVAQFLEPGGTEFDLLVIDEASQVQPVDALGAVARCKQIVVVGDSKQLPPTRFFSRLTAESSEEDEEEELGQVEAKDIESILGLCSARGLPESMLRWHYRSRHHSLIAVSNQQFYENKLFIVPSPFSAVADLGLKFNYVKDGIFDSGGTKTNHLEASEIAKAIIKHAIATPELSLGVATFSIHQKQAIVDELELLRRQHPEAESFFYGNPDEPFFIKNLENVQGDERDVIFISVGYARDARGYMAMRFGPLGACIDWRDR